MNYSGTVGSRYPNSILGVCCAQQPLREMKEIRVLLYFHFISVYSSRVDQVYLNESRHLFGFTAVLFCWFNWHPAGSTTVYLTFRFALIPKVWCSMNIGAWRISLTELDIKISEYFELLWIPRGNISICPCSFHFFSFILLSFPLTTPPSFPLSFSLCKVSFSPLIKLKDRPRIYPWIIWSVMLGLQSFSTNA